MSDLRTRIAAALERADKEPQPFDQGPVGYGYLADAVIAALDPRPDWRLVEDWHGKAGRRYHA
jgi:hypothetical protein